MWQIFNCDSWLHLIFIAVSLEPPLMKMDFLAVNQDMNDVQTVLVLPDGGVVVSNHKEDMYSAVRLDNDGSTVVNLYTSPVEITRLIKMNDEEILVLQKDGTIIRLKLVHGAVVVYKVDANYLEDGTLIDKNTLLLADYRKKVVFTYNLSTKISEVKVKGYLPACVTRLETKQGLFYAVCSWKTHQVHVYSSSWDLRWSVGGRGSDFGQLSFPKDVILLPTNTLLVADRFNNRVSEFTLQGCFIRHVLQETDGIDLPKVLSYQHPYLWVVYYNQEQKSRQLKSFQIYK